MKENLQKLAILPHDYAESSAPEDCRKSGEERQAIPLGKQSCRNMGNLYKNEQDHSKVLAQVTAFFAGANFESFFLDFAKILVYPVKSD